MKKFNPYLLSKKFFFSSKCKLKTKVSFHVITSHLFIYNLAMVTRRRKMDLIKQLELPQFSERIAEGFTAYRKPTADRPATATPVATTKYKIVPHPPEEVRYDLSLDHQNKWGNRKLCRFPSCKSQTQSYCATCNLHLCNSPKNNCHWKYHHADRSELAIE